MARKFLAAWAGYLIATFIGGFVWHLLLFKETYVDLKIFTRIDDPIIPLGLSAMFIQGALLAYIYPVLCRRRQPAVDGLRFGILAGVFLATSAVLGEAGKNYVTSLSTWLLLETTYYLLQFTFSGLVIALAYGRQEEPVEHRMAGSAPSRPNQR